MHQIRENVPGVMVDAHCRRNDFEGKIATQHMTVSLAASPEEPIQLLAKSPWESEIEELADKWRKSGVKSLEEVRSRKAIIRIEVEPFRHENAGMLAQTARFLLDRRYYDPKRPLGLTHDVIAKELGISKPTLEKRMRELESRGIRELYGTDAKLSREDIKASWDALLRSRKRPTYVA